MLPGLHPPSRPFVPGFGGGGVPGATRDGGEGSSAGPQWESENRCFRAPQYGLGCPPAESNAFSADTLGLLEAWDLPGADSKREGRALIFHLDGLARGLREDLHRTRLSVRYPMATLPIPDDVGVVDSTVR